MPMYTPQYNHVRGNHYPRRPQDQGPTGKHKKAMERTKSYVAAEAIRAYIELNEWQITEINRLHGNQRRQFQAKKKVEPPCA